jgi:hypothetical protein
MTLFTRFPLATALAALLMAPSWLSNVRRLTLPVS